MGKLSPVAAVEEEAACASAGEEQALDEALRDKVKFREEDLIEDEELQQMAIDGFSGGKGEAVFVEPAENVTDPAQVDISTDQAPLAPVAPDVDRDVDTEEWDNTDADSAADNGFEIVYDNDKPHDVAQVGVPLAPTTPPAVFGVDLSMDAAPAAPAEHATNSIQVGMQIYTSIAPEGTTL